MSTIHIITAGFRPAYIAKSIKYMAQFKCQPLIWHLIMDDKISIDVEKMDGYEVVKDVLKVYSVPTTYPYGFEQRRHFTETLSLQYDKNDWGYFLDDDNLMTPDIFAAFEKYKGDPTAKMVMMSQLRYLQPELNRLYGKKGNATTLGMVDIGSFIFRLEVLQGKSINVYNYSEDGNIVVSLYEQYGEVAFRYEEGLMTTYNILQITDRL
jgi:hypothetical protein